MARVAVTRSLSVLERPRGFVSSAGARRTSVLRPVKPFQAEPPGDRRQEEFGPYDVVHPFPQPVADGP